MVIRFTVLHFKVGQDESRRMGLHERVALVGGRQKAKGLYSDNLNSARSLSNASYIFDKTSTLHLGPPPFVVPCAGSIGKDFLSFRPRDTTHAARVGLFRG